MVEDAAAASAGTLSAIHHQGNQEAGQNAGEGSYSPLELASRNCSSRGSQLDATPRSVDAEYPSCVPYTPSGDEAQIFRYYCPLCMQYFRRILKMKCCGNYTCNNCASEYLASKRVAQAPSAEDSNTPCPHCQLTGFYPMIVSSEETVRDYSTKHPHSAGKLKLKDAQPSPLRIGESFEDLKRKMIPYRTAIAVGELSIPSPSEEGFVPLPGGSEGIQEAAVGSTTQPRFTPRASAAASPHNSSRGSGTGSGTSSGGLFADMYVPANAGDGHGNGNETVGTADSRGSSRGDSRGNSRVNSRANSRGGSAEYNHVVGIAMDSTISPNISPRLINAAGAAGSVDAINYSSSYTSGSTPMMGDAFGSPVPAVASMHNVYASDMVRSVLDSAMLRRTNIVTESMG